ncbi:hypothetical protein PRVXT_000477 [Proteinivorax tanatarense]|uniref:Uncharacterized protein n=1 Tax=Proteinivorax tanatarense TaxID=1260629 RepID=A0AAU7VNM4_9FIRM
MLRVCLGNQFVMLFPQAMNYLLRQGGDVMATVEGNSFPEDYCVLHWLG